MAIKVKETLFEGKSAYQDVKVLEIDSHTTLLTRIHVHTHTYTYILAHAGVRDRQTYTHLHTYTCTLTYAYILSLKGV